MKLFYKKFALSESRDCCDVMTPWPDLLTMAGDPKPAVINCNETLVKGVIAFDRLNWVNYWLRKASNCRRSLSNFSILTEK